MIDVNGKFYGTTEFGGTSGAGTVYFIHTDGAEKVLHSFAGGSDGSYPNAALVDVNGTMYGTTLFGGAFNHGTAYSIRTNGAEKVLHSFEGFSDSDGAAPYAALIDVNGTLYGTTSAGGGVDGGTAFALTP